MTTSESKGRFFLLNESIRITNRIESIPIANWNALMLRSIGKQSGGSVASVWKKKRKATVEGFAEKEVCITYDGWNM